MCIHWDVAVNDEFSFFSNATNLSRKENQSCLVFTFSDLGKERSTNTQIGHFENQSSENWDITINHYIKLYIIVFIPAWLQQEPSPIKAGFFPTFLISRERTRQHTGSDCFLILFDVCCYFSNPQGKSPQIKISWKMEKVHRKFTQFSLKPPIPILNL